MGFDSGAHFLEDLVAAAPLSIPILRDTDSRTHQTFLWKSRSPANREKDFPVSCCTHTQAPVATTGLEIALTFYARAHDRLPHCQCNFL